MTASSSEGSARSAREASRRRVEVKRMGDIIARKGIWQTMKNDEKR
jgi:hypothetical protein